MDDNKTELESSITYRLLHSKLEYTILENGV